MTATATNAHATDRVAELLADFNLGVAAAEMVPRLLAGGHDDALDVVAEVPSSSKRRVERSVGLNAFGGPLACRQ